MQNETKFDCGTENVKGLYVHVPFCDGKCFYCAFYSRPYESGLAQKYLQALEIELKEYPRLNVKPLRNSAVVPIASASGRRRVETIYFGGGTPSLLSLAELEALCNLVKKHISAVSLPVKEWTIECNPRSLTAEKLAFLAEAGVNRISLGAQSFADAALKWLGRRHRVADIYEAARMIKSAGFHNFSLDLIACIPGFKPDVWRHTLAEAVALGPEHISVYALTAEEGSRLAQQLYTGRANPCYSAKSAKAAFATKHAPGEPIFRRLGRDASPYLYTPHHQINLLSEDEELEALNTAANILAEAGYQRYEISNYARPGYECLHNLACWRGEEYIGLGPAAASHVGLKRWTNRPDLEKYLAAIENGRPPPRTMDLLSKNLKRIEMVVFGLRMSEGISEETGKFYAKTLRELAGAGLVLNASSRWRLTERGMNLADYVGAELLSEVKAE